jgi:YVTN family beta-propeller protein
MGLGLMVSGADAAHFVYVTNYLSHTISIIDTDSNTVAATFPVSGYDYEIAFKPDGKYAYIANPENWNVSVIDTNPNNAATYNTEVATIPVSEYPVNVGVTPDGKHAYVW